MKTNMQLQLLFLLLVSVWVVEALASTYRYNTTAIQTSTNHTIMKVGDFAKPGCKTECGGLTVPYPFGIIPEGQNSQDCSMSEYFQITCNTSTDPPKAFLQHGNLEIFDISDTELRIGNFIAVRCYDQYGSVYRGIYAWVNLGGPYRFSKVNVLIIVGCDDYGNIYQAKDDNLPKSCSTTCHNAEEVLKDECSGTGCCQTSVKVRKYFDIYLHSYSNHTKNMSYNPCGYAFLGEENSFQFGGLSDLSDEDFTDRIKATVPIVLDWVIEENKTCAQAQDTNSFACIHANSSCIDASSGGYRCICKQGYEGNPYLSPGCKDTNECADPSKNDCWMSEKSCINIPGNYSCSCPRGYKGDGRKNGSGCVAKKSKFPLTIVSLGNYLFTS